MRQNDRTNNLIMWLVTFVDFVVLNAVLYAFCKIDDSLQSFPWLQKRMFFFISNTSMLISELKFHTIVHKRIVSAGEVLRKVVVSSDTIGNNDCIKDNYNGFLLPMNAEQFADKVNTLLENEELRQQMETNSYSYFESNFNIANRIGELENIYQRIII